MVRVNVLLAGVVQGVGFRPFVFRLAEELGITGFARNVGTALEIQAEGDDYRLEQFLSRLKTDLPPLASIDSMVQIERSVCHAPGEKFEIVPSASGNCELTAVPPDVAVCSDCV
ncbi:MAG TPA: acylphosphatase, partial [Candidatus Obscuribacterales bacterium]